jgi:hypothetical protein
MFLDCLGRFHAGFRVLKNVERYERKLIGAPGSYGLEAVGRLSAGKHDFQRQFKPFAVRFDSVDGLHAEVFQLRITMLPNKPRGAKSAHVCGPGPRPCRPWHVRSRVDNFCSRIERVDSRNGLRDGIANHEDVHHKGRLGFFFKSSSE